MGSDRCAATAVQQLCPLGLTVARDGMRRTSRTRRSIVGRPTEKPAANARPTLATLIEYGAEPGQFRETSFTDLSQGEGFTPRYDTLWLNLHGLANEALLAEVGRRFHLHPLTLEDLRNTGQRPKVEVYPGYLYIVVRLIAFDTERQYVKSEQLSIVLGRQFVLTVQEQPTGTFEPLREELRQAKGLARRQRADYLVYALLDKVVDRSFSVLEQLGEAIEAVEDVVLDQPTTETLARVHELRRELLCLRRGLWPLREVLNTLQRDDGDYFAKETQLYLRDVYDHTVHLIESLEALRDLIGSLVDLWMSNLSNRMNREMRMLTVITTIFMPLSFIAGVYGMNFKHMPELDLPYGYFVTLGVMATLAGSMVLYFWRRRWL
jgi:magnesium transporter